MPRNGAGTFSLSEPPFVFGDIISETAMNSDLSDIANALTQSISADGQTPITANLQMNSYKHTGVLVTSGSGSRTEYASGATAQDNVIQDAGLTAGSSTVYTATLSPAITAYVDKSCYRVQFDEACGDSPTINFNSVGAKKIYKNVAGVAVQVVTGDIPANLIGILRYDSALDSAAGGFWIVALNKDEYTIARSSNTILAPADEGHAFLATTTFTQTLTAAATLGNGWWADYRNSGTGVITIDPNGAELIDGASTLELYPGDAMRLLCTGAAFNTIGLRGLRSKIVSFTRDLSSSAGNVAYTGAGFKPTCVIFFSNYATATVYISAGFSDQTGGGASIALLNGTATFTSFPIYIGNNTGAYQTGAISSYDADGFTITWAKTGAPSGTPQFYALCLR